MTEGVAPPPTPSSNFAWAPASPRLPILLPGTGEEGRHSGLACPEETQGSGPRLFRFRPIVAMPNCAHAGRMDIEGACAELERDDIERPVPHALRPMFHQIAEAFVDGDYGLLRSPVRGVDPVEPDVAKSISAYVLAYGDPLVPLDPETWLRSVYMWMDGYWAFLVDLSTTGAKVSDLTLHARLYHGSPLRLEIQSVHVQ
jgi:hypothetical protein